MPCFFVTGEWSREELAADLAEAWQGYLMANPDLEGEDLAYEGNWAGTLGLSPEEVRGDVLRVLRLTPYYGATAAYAAAGYARMARERDTAGDDAGAFELEELSARYAAGGWEVSADETLVPPGFVRTAAEAFGTWPQAE